jgi:flagellar hook-associated protein 1
MSNLLASLRSSANTLDAFDQVLAVTQNNVSNASTPGYAKQRLMLNAMSFDIDLGSAGGVRPGEIQSARDQFADQAVRRQATSLGYAQQNVSSLTSLESFFDVTGKSGISTALNNLFQAFSAWGQNPGGADARQAVIDRAGDLSTAFQQTAQGLASLSQDTDAQIRQTTERVNALVSELRDANRQRMARAGSNPGLEANTNSLLEQLSEYVDFSATFQNDGTVTVLLNGQTPLLIEDRQYPPSADFQSPTNPAPTYAQVAGAGLFASDGRDVTALTTGGKLGALLHFRNQVLPAYAGGPYTAGELNTLAKTVAGRVNQILTSGVGSDGVTPGVALFQYDGTDDTRTASSLAIDSSVTQSHLAATDPGPPSVANGIPLALSALASPQNAADKLNGMGYSAFFGSMAARVGSDLNSAQNQSDVQQSSLAQARELRQQASGVSLDEEATILIQFQRAYEATSRLITVLDQLTRDTIDILRP